MAQLDKLKVAFKQCAGPYPWRKFEQLLNKLGYELLPTGKTAGSRRKFVNKKTLHLIQLHEPHNGEMGPGMVRRMQRDLEEYGLI